MKEPSIKTLNNAIHFFKDYEKNKITLQIQSLLWRMYYDTEITNNSEVVEDLNSLKNEIEKWLLEQRYKK